jgi:hypothetical protein
MPDTSDATDSIFRSAGGSSAILHLSQRQGDHGYVGSLTLGVRS